MSLRVEGQGSRVWQKIVILVFFVLTLDSGLLTPDSLWAKEAAGTFGGVFLLMPTGVRSMGMGDTGAALASGSNGALYNPASIAYTKNPEVSLSRQELLAESSLNFLGYAQPLRFKGFNEAGGANFFTNFRYIDHGAIEVNNLNADGSLGETRSLKAGEDMALSLGYAENLIRERGGVHSLGISMQIIRTSLVEKYDAEAVGFNFGYLGNLGSLGIGLAVVNIGSKIKFLEVGDPQPVAMRAGLAYPFSPTGYLKLLTAYDIVYEERSFHSRAGVEARLNSGFAFRGGWRLEPESFRGGPTFGFGFDSSRFFIDYAFGSYGDLEATHRVLLGIKFSRFPFQRY